MGTYTFSLNVFPKGLAQINSTAKFSFSMSAVSINPKKSTTGGKKV